MYDFLRIVALKCSMLETPTWAHMHDLRPPSSSEYPRCKTDRYCRAFTDEVTLHSMHSSSSMQSQRLLTVQVSPASVHSGAGRPVAALLPWSALHAPVPPPPHVNLAQIQYSTL